MKEIDPPKFPSGCRGIEKLELWALCRRCMCYHVIEPTCIHLTELGEKESFNFPFYNEGGRIYISIEAVKHYGGLQQAGDYFRNHNQLP